MGDNLQVKIDSILAEYGVNDPYSQMMIRIGILNLFGKQKVGRWEELTMGLVDILLHVLQVVKETGNNDVSRSQLTLTHTQYNNLAKLRYWGLLHHPRRSDGTNKSGHWLITRRAGNFLRGEEFLPTRLLVQDNTVIQESTDIMSFGSHMYQGLAYWKTADEYRQEYLNNHKSQMRLI